MLDFVDLAQILKDIRFQSWNFRFESRGEGFLLQVEFVDPKDRQMWKGRKWYVSPHSTKSEVVQTAFKAVLTALEHEARESFLYKGEAIFGPHYDVDTLVSVCASKDVRSEPKLNPDLSLGDFIKKAEQYRIDTGQRRGQALFNMLVACRPDLSERIRGIPDMDPFYANDIHHNIRYENAIRFIQENW